MFHIDSRAALNDRDLDLKGGGGGVQVCPEQGI